MLRKSLNDVYVWAKLCLDLWNHADWPLKKFDKSISVDVRGKKKNKSWRLSAQAMGQYKKAGMACVDNNSTGRSTSATKTTEAKEVQTNCAIQTLLEKGLGCFVTNAVRRDGAGKVRSPQRAGGIPQTTNRLARHRESEVL